MILQKYISQSGYCSRREAEELIRAGRVKVNGKVAELGQAFVEGDRVLIGNEVIGSAPEKIFILLNKPRGYTCTTAKFEGERNVFEIISKTSPSTSAKASADKQPSPYKGEGDLITPLIKGGRGDLGGLNIVGRLDKDSRGLVILTNDGDFVYEMTHPKYEHEKEYITTISNYQYPISNEFVNSLIYKFTNGIDIGDGDGVVRAKIVAYLGQNKFKIILAEGKKRQIRRMFQAVGLEVEDLVRVRIDKFELGDLEEGKWKLISNA